MKLALSIPQFGSINNSPMNTTKFIDPSTNTPTIGHIVTIFGEVALFVGGFLTFFWAVWGVFDYIRAEGNKEALAKARKRIQWAIAGFVILLLAFFISDFVFGSLFDPKKGGIGIPTTPITNLTF